MKRKLSYLVLMILCAMCLVTTALASDDIIYSGDYYAASVTVNQAGNALEEGEWLHSSSITKIEGLYYVSSSANGADKTLVYINANDEARSDLGHIDTFTHSKGDYQMYRASNTTNWIAGTWTGRGLTTSVRDFSYTVVNYHMLAYNQVPSALSEKLYLAMNDKETVLAEYAEYFGEDSTVYSLINSYYNADGFSLDSIQTEIKDTVEATVMRYAFECDEIIPASDLVSFSFAANQRQGATITSEKVYSEALVYIADESGNVTPYTWQSANFDMNQNSFSKSHTVKTADIEGYPSSGWVVGIEIKPFANIGDKTKLELLRHDPSNTNQGLRFLQNQLILRLEPTLYTVKECNITPILSSKYDSDGSFIITVQNVMPDTAYAYRSADIEWTVLPTGENSFSVGEGVYYVKALANSESAESAVTEIETKLNKTIPELTLGEGYVLTAPNDSECYQYAKLGFNTTPVYADLTSVTLTEGVWSVIKKGDDIMADSDPQYFYIEGENAGSIVYATASGLDYVTQRWTGIISSASLFDFTAAWGGNSAFQDEKIDIYASLNTSHVTAGTYKSFGFKYLFDDSEIVPVSSLININATPRNIQHFYYDDNGTETKVTNWRTLARVYVVGADVAYYDVLGNATTTSYSFPLSDLQGMEGYAVAVELYPVYMLLDSEGNEIESPIYKANCSYAIYINPVYMDSSVTLGTGYSSTGIDENGNNKYSLNIADKGAAPTLSVENVDGSYKINIIGDGSSSYQYKSESSGWIILPEGQNYFITDNVGTYYVKTVASGNMLSSDIVSVTFEGVKETPKLIPDENNTITAPDGESYQYAKLQFNSNAEYLPLTTATLTEGVWAVKVTGDGTYLDSAPQYIYIMGENAGTIKFVVGTGRDFIQGKWIGTYANPNLFDWNNYNNLDNAFKNTNITIFQNTNVSSFTDGTYNTYGYKYQFEDSEIVPLSSLINIEASHINPANIYYLDGTNTIKITEGKTRARVHVIGGESEYYDVLTNVTYTATNGYKFELSALNKKPGYAVAVELYLFEELYDADGNLLKTAVNEQSTSHSLLFKNLLEDTSVTLTTRNEDGLDENGNHRYTLKISNDPRAPLFEKLEENPNGLRITNYILGETYAWAKAIDGVWTEFEGDTVEFTEFGSYYIKLVGKNGSEDSINLNPFKTDVIMMEGTSLVLDGAIGVRFYFGVDTGVKYSVSYAINGEDMGQIADEASGSGRRYVTIPVYPKDAESTNITVSVKNLATLDTLSLTTSIPQYIESLRDLAESGDESCLAALDVVNAVDEYTAYASNFFNKANAALPDVNADTTALEAIASPARIDANLKGGTFNSTSLILDAETTIRHYFEVTDETVFEGYTAYCNEEVIKPQIKSGTGSSKYYTYDISDIPAHKLDTVYTLEIFDGNGNLVAKVSYSVLNYLKSQLNSEDIRMSNLSKAMYNYYSKSDDYKITAQNPDQRGDIIDAMTLAMNTVPAWKEVPEYNPTTEKYSHIKAITYDGFEYQGQKTKVFAYVGFPEGASEDDPVPAIVLVHGGGGHPYMEWVRVWNARGYAAIAMETTGYFPSEPGVGVDESDNSKFVYGMTDDFYEDGYTNAPSRSYSTSYTEVENQWAYHGLSQVILAGNILRDDARVDADKIGITGVSWGGTMVSQIIGYDNRYAFAIPIYGTAYLSNEMHTFSSFNDTYVNYLWAAERNLDNATMPILWLAYNDDNNFSVPAYCSSFLHTNGVNDKNALLMMNNWSHSHGAVFYGKGQAPSNVFADWATNGSGGFVTFTEQPKMRDVNCNITIPDGATNVSATVYYITEPMSYTKFDKYNWGNSYTFLTPYWQTDTSCLNVDSVAGTVSGTVPDTAKGYYIGVTFTVNGITTESSSLYVALD